MVNPWTGSKILDKGGGRDVLISNVSSNHPFFLVTNSSVRIRSAFVSSTLLNLNSALPSMSVTPWNVFLLTPWSVKSSRRTTPNSAPTKLTDYLLRRLDSTIHDKGIACDRPDGRDLI